METLKQMFRVNRKDIHYLRTTIEAYDGMAVVRTVERSGDRRSLRRRVDATEATIELLIAPGCENLISKLLTSLKEKEGIPLQAVAASSKG